VAQQLHYTSAERGLAGHAGFQFVAEASSVTPDVRHVVMPFMSYRPPPDTPPQPDPTRCAALPVSLCYQRTADRVMLVRCRYLGQDYSGRYGNFLGHAVVAAPEELEGIRPIELWGAAFWAERPASDGALAELAEVTPGPEISPDLVTRHLGSLGERGYALLGSLLDAVLDCLAGRTGRVVLAAERTGDVAVWIAALSYSLPFEVATELSFTTYTADPESAQQRLVGTTPDVLAAIARPGRAFRLDRADGVLDPPGRFAQIVVGAWRASNLAAIDALSELAGHLDGDLALAGTLVTFSRGAELGPEESAAVVEALRGAGRGLPDWLWDDLAAVLPSVGTDLASAIYRVADARRRQDIAGPAGAPFAAALLAADELGEVVRLLRLAADAGLGIPRSDVVGAASGCARQGRGDVLAAHRDCPHAYRQALLTGVLGGLAATDEAVRRTMLTPALCDWLADLKWPAGHEMAPAVWVSVGSRNPGRRDELMARVAGAEDRSPAERAEMVARMWGREVPSPSRCLVIIETVGRAVGAQPPVLGLVGRPLAEGEPRAEDTTKLAGVIAELSGVDGPGGVGEAGRAAARAVADAHLLLELNALREAVAKDEDAVTPLLRLQRGRVSGTPALVEAVTRETAQELLGTSLNVRMGLYRKLPPELRSAIGSAWADLDYRTPAEVTELAATVLALHRERLGVTELDKRLLRLLQRKPTRQRVEQALRGRDSKMLAELAELTRAASEKRGVLSLFTRKRDS
jgi:hypothetical protein